MKTIKSFIIVVLLFLFSINIHAQTDWLMVNRCPQRTNYLPDETVLKPPLKIETNIPQWGEYILKEKNIIYLADGGSPNSLRAYDFVNQKELWKFEVEGTAGAIDFYPAIFGNKIFIAGQHSKGLYALDKMTGEQKWFVEIGNLFRRSPIVDNEGHVFIWDKKGDILCLNEDTGTIIWSTDISQGYGNPTYSDNKIFISTPGEIIVLNSKTGEEIWSQNHSPGTSGHVLIDDSGVYLCVGSSITCYVANNGTKKWSWILPDTLITLDYGEGTACLTDSVICVTLSNSSYTESSLVAISKFNGGMLWQYNSKFPLLKVPVAANGFVYACANLRPWIAGFNQMTGKKVFEDTSQNYWSTIIADHGLYALSSAGITIFKSKTSATTDNSINKDISIAAYPNPTNDEMTISYDIPQTGKTKISLFDINGKGKVILNNKKIVAGKYKLHLNNREIKQGIYFIVIKNEKFTGRKKLIFMR